MTVATETKTIGEQVKSINMKYKHMQTWVLKLMTHPDATAEDVETARTLLLETASALIKAQDKFEKAGYTIDRLEGITKKHRFSRS
jgi:hypothetical protein